jgi:hypothetical protein
MLAGDFPGAAELREQAAAAVAVGLCRCGCPTIYLSVDRARAQRAPVAARVSVESVAHDEMSFLLVFTDDGWLTSLELAWVTDEPPETFPPVEAYAAPRAASV